MNLQPTSALGQTKWPVALFCLALIVTAAPAAAGTVTNGYITAVLRSACTSVLPPPPVGVTNIGPGYVIATIADADPSDFAYAQQVVTDAIFENLMPLYCALIGPQNPCVTDSVQWNIVTYDSQGQPVTSGSPASGPQMHSCAGFESGAPLILIQPSDQSVNSGQTVTFRVDVSGLAPLYYQWMFDQTNTLIGATNSSLILPNVHTNQAGTYQVQIANALGGTNSRAAVLTVNPGPAATNGYIAAVLRSVYANAPTQPPPVGAIAAGSNYVMMTVADANPWDFDYAQQAATDAIFERLMPQYCALVGPGNPWVTDSVQWGIITYSTDGQPVIYGCAASGCQLHSCSGFESGSPFILAQPTDRAANTGQRVTFSVGVSGMAPLYYQWVFNQSNILAGATNSTLELPDVHTNQAGTYQVQIANALGGTNSRAAVLTVNPGPAATNGYIAAVLRSDCADAPTPPPPVGEAVVGTNYVIMTVADANPWDFNLAQQVATDTIFQTLMPLYCALPETTNNCVKDYVQWGIITYDVDGNPVLSGCAASGCDFHSCTGSATPARIPWLTISPSTTNLGVSWPTMASDFVLEESTNLFDWYPATLPMTTNLYMLSAQLPGSSSGHFFRLRQR